MTDDTRKKLLHRLAIAEGHVKKVSGMIEDKDYCIDIIHQSRAVQSALRKVDEAIFQSHLNSCVLKDVRGGGAKSKRLVGELVELFEKKA